MNNRLDSWLSGLRSWLGLNIVLLICMVAMRPLFFLEVHSRLGVAPVQFFTILSGAVFDLLLVARIFCFGLIPFLLLHRWRPKLARGIFLGLTILYIVVNALLMEYYCNLGMPLDHVILVYTPEELKTTVFSSASITIGQVLWMLLLVALPVFLAFVIVISIRHNTLSLIVLSSAIMLSALVSYPRLLRTEALYPAHEDFCLAVNQPSYSWVKIMDYRHDGDAQKVFESEHEEYPFYRQADDPDVLGPFLEESSDGLPPNLVFVVVESLGQRLTGVDVPGISFTPFIDSLAQESLYWPNCLSTAERTFGVLPSLFASAPHGRYGFSTPLAPTPRHHSLLKDLKRNGYRLSFFYGGDMAFDRYDFFLKDNGVDFLLEPEVVVSDSATYRLMVDNHRWGLDDAQLFHAAERCIEADTLKRPRMDLFLTLSTHEPFLIDAIEYYESLVRRMVEQAGNLSDKERDNVLRNTNIFACYLYADQCVRELFHFYRRQPGFENTLFMVTGDHRMGPLPFGNAIHKYNVPFLVYSPLLKRSKTMRAVVSHLDVTPSLNAYLHARYDYAIDSACHWLGRAFDTVADFRSERRLLFMLNNRDAVDYLQGDLMLSRSKLARLDSCFRETVLHDDALLDTLQKERARFDQRSRYVVQNDLLLPPDNDRLLYECHLDFEKHTLAVFNPYLDRDSGFLHIDSLETYFPLCSHIKVAPQYHHLTVEVSFDLKNLDPAKEFPELVVEQGSRRDPRPLALETAGMAQAGAWRHFRLRTVVNVFDQKENEELKLYLFNRHKTELQLDNLRVTAKASIRRP